MKGAGENFHPLSRFGSPFFLFSELKGSPLDYKPQCGHKIVDTISTTFAL